MKELWDAYDVGLNKLNGVTLVRGELIPQGVFHLVCEIAVKHVDGQYLIMQRDLSKHRGGMWELTAGGSALQGETPVECAVRELKEETGIICNELLEIRRVIHMGQRTYYIDYLCTTNCDKNTVKLQYGETIAYKWVDKSELKNNDNLVTKRAQLFIKELR